MTGADREPRRRSFAYRGAGTSGQALPLALVALALGAVLIAPLLTNVSLNLTASRLADEAVADYYAADAGIEWALWRLKGDPTLTSSSTYAEAPLQPTPATINGASFPTTEIRFVTGAGASETITPAWQSGSDAKCYAFTSTEAGSVFAVIETGAATVLADLRTSCSSGGLPTLTGSSPYTLQFTGQAAGSYQLVIQTIPADTGTVLINYPVASYNIRSQRDGRTITARAAAGTATVAVVSWQVD